MHFVLLSWCAVLFARCVCVSYISTLNSLALTVCVSHNALSSVWCPLGAHKMTALFFLICCLCVCVQKQPHHCLFGLLLHKYPLSFRMLAIFLNYFFIQLSIDTHFCCPYFMWLVMCDAPALPSNSRWCHKNIRCVYFYFFFVTL